MPLYDYRCANGHTRERIVRYEMRDEAAWCECGALFTRLMHTPHCVPDGMYSFAPNVGSEAEFARRLDAIRNGQKLINKSGDLTG